MENGKNGKEVMKIYITEKGMEIDKITEDNIGKWFCKICDQVFRTSGEMVRHLVGEHRRGKKITRKREASLTKWYYECERIKKVRCPECEGWGAFGKKSLKCIHCGNRFNTRETAFMDGVYLNEWDVKDRYEKYIEEGTERLKFSDRNEIIERATEIVEDLSGTVKSGKNPRTIASGAVYISGIMEGNRRTQREVAEAFNITEATLRSGYKEIAETMALI